MVRPTHKTRCFTQSIRGALLFGLALLCPAAAWTGPIVRESCLASAEAESESSDEDCMDESRQRTRRKHDRKQAHVGRARHAACESRRMPRRNVSDALQRGGGEFAPLRC